MTGFRFDARDASVVASTVATLVTVAISAMSGAGIVGCGGRIFPEGEPDAGTASSSRDGGPVSSTTVTGPLDASADVAVVADVAAPDVAASSACPPAQGPVTVSAVSSGGGFVAVDEARVYWTDPLAGSVDSAPIMGGPTTVIATGQVEPSRLVVDATNVYWANSVPGGSVVRASKDGSGAPVIMANTKDPPAGLAVDATSVYWTTYGTASDGTIARCAIDDCLPSVLLSGRINPDSLAVDATNLYWTEHDFLNGGVFKAAIGGEATLMVAESSPLGLAIDDANVYFTTNEQPFFVGKLPILGMAPSSTVLAPRLTDPRFVAVDEARVYWTDNASGEILATNKDGTGSPSVLAKGQTEAIGIAVDGCNVYWTTSFAVLRMAK